MTAENKEQLLKLLQQYKSLGISEQIDYEKIYLYSLITHSTAIEGSTVTEVEAQLLFDEGITSSKRTIVEQNMNLDLKAAYDYGRKWIKRHEDITTASLNCMAKMHCAHLKHDIDQFLKSIDTEMVDKQELQKKMVDKWSIKPSLADKLADILIFASDKREIRTEMLVGEFGIAETSAKRYLRQLTEYGYLEAHGGNKNRTYSKKRV